MTQESTDQASSNQSSTELNPQQQSLSYGGVSSYHKEGTSPQIHLFVEKSSQIPSVQLEILDPLPFREVVRTFLEVNGTKAVYQPKDMKIYEAYSAWRHSLDPLLGPLKHIRSFNEFLQNQDPSAWIGSDPTLTLNDQGLYFELLDPSARVYGQVHFPSSSFTLTSDTDGQHTTAVPHFSTLIEGSSHLRESLSNINGIHPLKLVVEKEHPNLPHNYQGELTKVLPSPENWQRSYTQLISAMNLPLRRINLSRMDLYNLLRHL